MGPETFPCVRTDSWALYDRWLLESPSWHSWSHPLRQADNQICTRPLQCLRLRLCWTLSLAYFSVQSFFTFARQHRSGWACVRSVKLPIQSRETSELILGILPAHGGIQIHSTGCPDRWQPMCTMSVFCTSSYDGTRVFPKLGC